RGEKDSKMQRLRVFLLLPLVVGIMGSPIPDTTETVDVKFIRRHQHPRIRRDVAQLSMPEVIISSFGFNGNDIILRLRRVQNLPTYIAGDNGVRQHTNTTQDSAVYVDPSRSASMIAMRFGSGAEFVLEGTLEHQGRKLSMTPVLRRRRSPGSKNPHSIAIVAERINFGHDGLPPHQTGHSNNQGHNPVTVVRRKRQTTGSTVHTVETVFVVDHSDYTK
ncbi:hypothetical protein BaRGS_00036524, partial [Batillaria attramentaria]